MLVDSHCHLDFPDFQDDFEDVLARAKESGIETMVTICTHVSKFAQVLAIAQAHDHIYCTVGIHPHNADKEDLVSVEKLVELASDPKVIGLGETGLDYFYDQAPRDLQRQQFRTHITVARQLDLPVIIHTREAEEDTLEILREEMAIGPFRALIHCFTASQDFADAVLEMGLYISISGIVTFKNAQDLRDAVKTVPLDRLLVETDAPYLAPIPKRGKRNEPAFTAHTAAAVAELKGISVEEAARQTTDNFFRLFSKAQRVSAA